MDLFDKDGTLNAGAFDDRSKLQIEAELAVMMAEYEQVISACRDTKGDRDHRPITVLADRIDLLRSFVRARAVAAGERAPGHSVNG